MPVRGDVVGRERPVVAVRDEVFAHPIPYAPAGAPAQQEVRIVVAHAPPAGAVEEERRDVPVWLRLVGYGVGLIAVALAAWSIQGGAPWVADAARQDRSVPAQQDRGAR